MFAAGYTMANAGGKGPTTVAHHRAPPPYTGPVFANYAAPEAQQPHGMQTVTVGGAPNGQQMPAMYVLAYVPVSSVAPSAPAIALGGAQHQQQVMASTMPPPPSYQAQRSGSGSKATPAAAIQKPQSAVGGAATFTPTQSISSFSPFAAGTQTFMVPANTFAFPMQGLSASKHTTEFLPARQVALDREGGESPSLFSVPSLNPSIWLNREATDIDASMWSISERPAVERASAPTATVTATTTAPAPAPSVQSQPPQKKVAAPNKGSEAKANVESSQPTSTAAPAVPTAQAEAIQKVPKPNFTDICRHRAMGACNRKHCRFVHPSDEELTMLRAIGKLPPLPDSTTAGDCSSENGASDTHSSWMGSKESQRSDL